MFQLISSRLARWLPYVASLALALGAGEAPASADPHPLELLRTRVAEELAREGIPLAGLERSLAVAARGQGVVVSLIDKRTGQVVSEREVAHLPADREAAIAHLTMLVASMLQAEHLQAGSRAPALLSGWRAAFVPARIAAYHRPASIAVLAGGDRRGEAGAAVLSAAEALEAAYREAAVGLVADGSSLGDLAALDDTAIVARAASLPVGTIAVVRVFLGGPKLRAIVSLYDRTGALVTAYTATAGEPMRAPAQDNGPVQGISSEAIGAVLFEHDRVAALHEYERRAVTTTFAHGKTGSSRLLFFVGVGDDKHEVNGTEFYAAVGRPDLEKKYRNRTAACWMVFGLGAVVGSVPLFMILAEDRASSGTAEWSIALGTASIGVMGGLLVLQRARPMDERDRQALAREHNRRLRKELGLPDATDDHDQGVKPRPGTASLSLHWAPFVSRNGGGLDVLLRF